MEINGYQLSRAWFDWSFENPEKVSPNHSAIFFFAIEHCNRLGWKDKFGFPTQMVMDAIGIKKHQTYIRYFNDLVEWGFFKMVQKSQNQYSANIISLQSAKPKNGKALDKAFINHAAKQIASIGQGNGQSNSPIDKPINQLTINQLTINKEPEDFIFDSVSDLSGLHVTIRETACIPIRIYQQSFNKWLESTFGLVYDSQKMNIKSKPPIEEFFKSRNGDIYEDNNHLWSAFKKMWLAQPASKTSKLQQ